MDIQIVDHGSVVQFVMHTDAARNWVRENVEYEGWQMMGGALCVEHHIADDLAWAMAGSGLSVG